MNNIFLYPINVVLSLFDREITFEDNTLGERGLYWHYKSKGGRWYMEQIL